MARRKQQRQTSTLAIALLACVTAIAVAGMLGYVWMYVSDMPLRVNEQILEWQQNRPRLPPGPERKAYHHVPEDLRKVR